MWWQCGGVPLHMIDLADLPSKSHSLVIKVHAGAYFVWSFDLSLNQHHTQAGTTPERDGGSRHGIHHSATKYTSEKRHRVVRSRQCAGVQAGIRAGN